MLKVYEPKPADSHKSFYGKCDLYENELGEKALRSYRTIVMTRDADGELHRHWPGWSATTARHIAAASGIATKEYRAMKVEPLPFEWQELQYTL